MRQEPEKDPRILADAPVIRRAREEMHLCAHCDAPLRSAREQAAKLCSWCEESLVRQG
jgi:NADH pyrophosphatase NudC (nudix superfamily)